MNNSFIGAIARAFTGYTIIKAAAHSQNQICFLNSVVGPLVTMKAGHAQEQTAISADGAQAHKSAHNGNMQLFA